MPEKNNCELLIEMSPSQDEYYEMNNEGLRVGLFDEIQKQPSSIAKFKTASSLIYVLAAIYCNNNFLDDVLILNTKSRIIEAVASNLFIIKTPELITPGEN